MFCTNCGRDIGDSKYCPFCGYSQDGGSTYMFRGDGIADLYRDVFRDPLFMIICILMTVAAALSFVSKESGSGNITISVGVLEILYVIALWLIFAAARNQNRFSGTGLAMASGVVKATYIITWIVAGIVLVAGVLVLVFGPLAIDNIDWDFTRSATVVQASLISPGPGSSGSIPLPEGFEWIEGLDGLDGLDRIPYITSISVRAIGVIMMIAAVVVILINIFYIRNLHKFTKSLCTSLASDQYQVVKANTSSVWLLVSAIVSVLGIVGSISLISGVVDAMSVIRQLCTILATVLSFVMIRKYFVR